MNRLGQRGPTELEWDSATYAARIRAFGWHAIELNGHDVTAIDRAYAEAISTKGRPTCLIAKTEKGHGVSLVANKEGWHGKALNAEQAKQAISELGGERNIRVSNPKPEPTGPKSSETASPLVLPTYKIGTEGSDAKSLRRRIGGLGQQSPGNRGLGWRSVQFDLFRGIQEGPAAPILRDVHCRAADGGRRGRVERSWKRPFASTFAAFFARAYDHIRMAAVSNVTIHLCGFTPA